MSQGDPVNALNRLLAIEYRSLPMYLIYCSPWTHRGDALASTVLEGIVRDQESFSQRIAEFILDQNAAPQTGEFPVEFTDLNFLSLDYLLSELVHYQKQDVAEIESLAARLWCHPQAKALVEEVLGSARAHLDSLTALAPQTV